MGAQEEGLQVADDLRAFVDLVRIGLDGTNQNVVINSRG